MKSSSNRTRNLLASALSVGLLLGAGQVMANDPPRANTHAANHDSNEPVTDTWITTKVKADLLSSSNVPGTDVKVETVNGVVTLSGTVATKAEHDKAITVARGIKGVKSVDSKALKVTGSAAR